MAEYERRTIDKNIELDIITGMITNSEYLKQIIPIFKEEYLTLPYSKKVASWALEYFKAYEKSPEKDIIGIFESKKAGIRDAAQIETIETFLDRLSSRFENQESYNCAYEVDKSVKFFKERAIDNLIDRLKVSKMSGNLDAAEAGISNFKQIAKDFSPAIDVWTDKEACVRAIRDTEKNDVLFSWPGEVGKFIRPIRRQEFAAVLAPSGRGKTWMLNEIALLSSFNKLNVVYFSFEMTEQQTLQRFYQRITGQLEPTHNEYDEGEEIGIPYFDANYETTKKIFFKKEHRNRLDLRSSLRQMNAVNRMVGSKSFKLICAPSGSMSVADLNTALDNLENLEDFIPDMVLIDYPDIMKAKGGTEKRHQIDEIWMGLRAISQARNCCVFAVSHTNKQTFDRDIKQGDYSEAAVKSNHLTLSISLNQNEQDMENSCVRLSIMKDRFAKFNPKHEIVVLQCLDVGQVFLDARRFYKEKSS